MKRIKMWQTIVLVGVLLASGGGMYAWRHAAATANAAALPANTQLVAVRAGNVTNSVSASGSLSFTNKSNLTFGSAGAVAQVNAAVGDLVKKGQVMAKLDTTSLQDAVAQAQVGLNSAQTALDNAKNPYSTTDLQKAQNAVAQAEFNLKKAHQALVDAQTVDPLVVATRQNALTAAQQTLATAQTVDPLVVSAKQLAVTQAQISLQNAQDNLAVVMTGPSAADLARADAAVALAQVALGTATAALPTALPDNLTINSYSSYLTKQAAYETAQANLQAALEALAKLQASPAAADVTKAQANVAQAQQTLSQAQSDLAKAQTIDPLLVANKQAALTQAQEDLATAQTTDPLVLAQKNLDIANAQVALASANDNLATVTAGADSNNVAAKTLQYQAAKTTYDDALAQIAAAALLAPFDGTVTAVSIIVGQNVSANATVITVVDTSTVEADASVSESDVANVKVGQTATLAVDALSGVPITGKVSFVSVVGKTSSGVVTYPIIVQVTALQGVQLREGMSVTATLVIQQVTNVLLVPNRAIGGTSRNPTVTVVANGQNEVRQVTLGLADSSYTQVLSGVSQGEEVLVSTAGTINSSNQRFFDTGGAPPSGGLMPGLGG